MQSDKKRLKSAFVRCPLYKVNGTGRDLYISDKVSPKNMLYRDKTTNRQRFLSPKIIPKFNRLVNDGTGRDQYIVHNNGGCIKSGKKDHYLKNFLVSLRNYNYQKQERHIFDKMGTPQKLNIGKENKSSYKKQKKLCDRLIQRTPLCKKTNYENIIRTNNLQNIYTQKNSFFLKKKKKNKLAKLYQIFNLIYNYVFVKIFLLL